MSKPSWAPRPIHRGTLLFSLLRVAFGNWAYGALLERMLGTAPAGRARSVPTST